VTGLTGQSPPITRSQLAPAKRPEVGIEETSLETAQSIEECVP
jgi:hypothetical protein